MPYQVQPIASDDWPRLGHQIMAIEEACFEPARRDTPEQMAAMLVEPGAIASIATENDQILGYCLGVPLEFFHSLPWVAEDPEFRRRTTLYAGGLAISPSHRGQGIDLALKTDQVNRARDAGYHYITGRYRVGLAEGMRRIAAHFGAQQAQFLKGVYTDDLDPKDGVYYRIDLGVS